MHVTKVGGSLLDLAEQVMAAVGNDEVVVVPGGGAFADQVRAFCSEWATTDEVAHRMAILAMHQYGLYLAHISGLRPIEDPADFPGILQPYRFLDGSAGLPCSWDVTSDSIAAFVAAHLGLPSVRLVKRGIVWSGRRTSGVLTTRELHMLGAGFLDRYLPRILEDSGITCEVYCVDAVERFLDRYAAGQPDLIIQPALAAGGQP